MTTVARTAARSIVRESRRLDVRSQLFSMYRRGIVARMVHPRAGRSWISAALLLAAIGCALVLGLTGVRPRESSMSPGPPAGSPFTLMQMNLCLSGLAGCYGKVA